MPRRQKILVYVVLLLVAGLFLVMSNQRFYFLQGSSAGDILLARALASGEGFREVWRLGSPPCTVRPPGLAAIMAGIIVLIGENLLVFKLVNNLFGAAAFAGALLLLRKRMHTLAGPLLIAAFAMTLPFWIGIARHLYSGILFTALVLWSLFMFEREQERGFKSAFAVAAFSLTACGAILTRAIGVALPAAAVVAFVLNRHAAAGRRLYLAAILVLITGLCFGGWTLRNYFAKGAKDPPYLSKLMVGEPLGSTYWLAEDQAIPLIPEPRKLTVKRFAKRINDNAKYYLFNTGEFLVPALKKFPPGVRTTLTGLWFIITMAGLAIMMFRERRISEIYAGMTLLVALFWPFPHPRFFLPALPVFLLATVTAVRWFMEKSGVLSEAAEGRKAWICGVIAGAVFLVPNLASDIVLIKERFKGPRYKLDRPGMIMTASRPASYAGLLLLDYVREHTPPDSKIMFHSIHPCGLVSERVCSSVPMAGPERTLDWVRDNGIDYIIMDSEKGAFGASYFSYQYLLPFIQKYEDEKLVLIKSYEVPLSSGTPPTSLYKVKKKNSSSGRQ